jgi:hypothetical protein
VSHVCFTAHSNDAHHLVRHAGLLGRSRLAAGFRYSRRSEHSARFIEATQPSAIGSGQILGLHDGNAAAEGKVIAASVDRIAAAPNKTAQNLAVCAFDHAHHEIMCSWFVYVRCAELQRERCRARFLRVPSCNRNIVLIHRGHRGNAQRCACFH